MMGLREGELMAEGLLIVGVQAGCGKTVAAAGLSSALAASGLSVMACKPLTLAACGAGNPQVSADLSRVDVPRLDARRLTPQDRGADRALIASQWASSRAGGDQAFLNRSFDPALLAHLPEPLTARTAYDVSATDWQALLQRCRRMPVPCLFEAAGPLGAPWAIHGDETEATPKIEDALTFARALGLPVLWTVAKSASVVAQLRLASAFLDARPLMSVGWIAVETAAPALQTAPDWERDVACLARMLAAPYLGLIPYSPSVSVRGGAVGNLQRLSEDAIDLLPIRRALRTLVT